MILVLIYFIFDLGDLAMYSNGFDPCMVVKGFRWSERKGSGIAPEQ